VKENIINLTERAEIDDPYFIFLLTQFAPYSIAHSGKVMYPKFGNKLTLFQSQRSIHQS